MEANIINDMFFPGLEKNMLWCLDELEEIPRVAVEAVASPYLNDNIYDILAKIEQHDGGHQEVPLSGDHADMPHNDGYQRVTQNGENNEETLNRENQNVSLNEVHYDVPKNGGYGPLITRVSRLAPSPHGSLCESEALSDFTSEVSSFLSTCPETEAGSRPMSQEVTTESILTQITSSRFTNLETDLFPMLREFGQSAEMSTLDEKVLGWRMDGVGHEMDIPTATYAGDHQVPIPEFGVLLHDQKKSTARAYNGESDAPMSSLEWISQHVTNPQTHDGNNVAQDVASDVFHGVSVSTDQSDDDTDCNGDSVMLEDLADVDYIPPSGDRHRPVKRGGVNKTRLKVDETDLKESKRSRRKSPQLWKFLLNALCDPSTNPSIIEWTDWEKGFFQLNNTHKISHIWGQRLGHKPHKKPMTYEKFSRAIRYYYKDKVLLSGAGRLRYQFGPGATGWKATARQYHAR